MPEYKVQSFKGKDFRVIRGIVHPDYSYHTFEREEHDFREKYWDIQPNDIVLDVGSSYGSYALTACAMGATVYAFEPETTVYNDFMLSVGLNGWHTKCIGHNFGLYSSETELDFGKAAPHWPQFCISSLYKMKTLDDVVMEYKLSKLDWIKIDVEGGEE